MFLWRISDHADLIGLGGERSNGRWHMGAPDKRIVYLAEHPAVALIENIANLRGDPRFFPEHYQLLRITAADSVKVHKLTPKQLAGIDPEKLASTQAIGDAWLAAKTSALLRVPSMPSPESWNYLLNPLHADAAALKVDWARAISYDKRLFHLAGA
jgi:RES domain-containing protein